MVLNDKQILELMENSHGCMIHPFESGEKRSGRISYGLSSCGYDVRLAPELRLLREWSGMSAARVIDPKDPNMADLFHDVEYSISKSGENRGFIIPPHGFALGRTVERLQMPPDVCAMCVGKSTYARCGLVVNTTPIEPGWCGTVTLELSNTTDLPLSVYADEGIAQLIFHRIERPEKTYADKGGKYQDQKDITFPRVD